MIDAVFISDLHLHPDEIEITGRFNQFVDWALEHTRAVYILGDFFHAWAGDDTVDAWSKKIAGQLAKFSEKGIKIYFMHGNRDFLLGHQFAKLAKIKLLAEPTVIQLNQESILLAHGDRYCTQDKAHQWFRWLTRNAWFPPLFLHLPQKIRIKLVTTVRQHSQMNRRKPLFSMDIVKKSLLNHMHKMQVYTIIHGHTHKPGLTTHLFDNKNYLQYVLSDWDDNPQLLCYDKSKGFYFYQLVRASHA